MLSLIRGIHEHGLQPHRSNTMKILVTRTDRLGDVLLATPVLKTLRERFPQASITFLVQAQWQELLQYPDVALMTYTVGDSTLSKKIAQEKFDVAVVLRDEKEVSLAIKKAKVPIRMGPYSTWWSFLVFNRGKLQKRSQCEMHEAEYNLQLLSQLDKSLKTIPATHPDQLPRSWIQYSPGASQKNFQEAVSKLICFHPGSSGSARYLKTNSMVELVQKLKKAGYFLVLTGLPSEKELLTQIAQGAGLPPEHLFVGKTLSELAELFRVSLGVIAHGTGPLHLAAAVDTHVFAIFSPIFVLSEKRWGPLTSKRFTWVPQVKCPAKYKCIGPKCSVYDCMDLFSAEVVLREVSKWKK